MKTINVKYSKNLDFDESPSLLIDTYKWADNGYIPETFVYLCYNESALKIKLKAFEKEITVKSFEDDGNIWCDSCVEFFIRPFLDDKRYINFEINPLGFMIMGLRENRQNKISVIKESKEKLNVKAMKDVSEHNKEYWEITFEIPFELLCSLYGKKHIFKKGDVLMGNFYKCGDETPFPHFGAWNEVETDTPDFHRPEYFGEIILG